MRWLAVLLLLGSSRLLAQQTVELCPGNRNTFTYYSSSNTFGTWSWVLEDDTVSSSSSVTLTWSTAGDFQLIAFFDNGCPTPPQTYLVHVIECAEAAIYFPNAFTPDGDRNNEKWGPKGVGITEIKWSVFNRWGEMIYESDSMEAAKWWDGTYMGRECQIDIYVYKAEWKDVRGRNGQKYGHIALVR